MPERDVDAQTLRKTLREAATAAEGRDPAEIAVRARARAQTGGSEVALRLAALLEDPDWIAPPSVRRRIAGALTYFGDPDSVPQAARAIDGATLVDWVSGEIGPEIEAWKSFDTYRTRVDRRNPDADARTQKLYDRRRRLRARLQSGRPN